MTTHSNSCVAHVQNARLQQGASAIVMLFYVAIFSLLLTCAVKMGPVYMESWTFSKILQSLPEQLAEESPVTKRSIRDRLAKRIHIDMIDAVKVDDVKIDRVDDDFVVTADYETRVGLFANVDVVMSFENEVAIPISR